MAQINLGSIKFNWKGSYSGATAYVVDDVVESSGSSYICILATTGNAPPNATYWEQMSSAGTNGTDGTDLGTTLTTQGDLVYRNASGLARLGAGTSGQVLQTGGAGANPSWTTVSSDYVKLATIDHSGSNVSEINVDGFFSSTYKTYKVFINSWMVTSTGTQTWLRFRTSSGTQSGADYKYASDGQMSDGTDSNMNSNSATALALSADSSSTSNYTSSYEFTIFSALDTSQYKTVISQAGVTVNNNIDAFRIYNMAGIWTGASSLTGINLTAQATANRIAKVQGVVYGIK